MSEEYNSLMHDILDKLDISTLEKLREAFKKILSTMKITSETLNQLLLDYQNDKNLMKTYVTKLESYASTLLNQIEEKAKEVKESEKFIKSIVL
ncbi:hypothetical protein LRB67_04920 [Borreliella bissettiae]|uniref:CRASP family complement regulator-acquiring lipoprotein n=1 Tax=Borrelia bissettiae TaxID=64897 RepID=UPI001E4698EE|nr:CRASP family complement regulator-acquiring lipoprotein [Borreliella bissettiae]MCD2401601.1 hypothetical protein [Borreliella bissettiae]